LYQEYGITYIPTYPCGNIGLMVCRKAFDGDHPNDAASLSCAKAVRPVPTEVIPHLSFYNSRLHEAAFAAPTFVNRQLADLLPSAAAAASTL
jgi:spermidine synthase